VACAGLAGVPEVCRREKSGAAPRLSAVLLVTVAAATVVGCGGGAGAKRLLDGSTTVSPPVDLQGVEGRIVRTKVRIWRAGGYDPQRLGACLARGGPLPDDRLIVERVGVTGESISFRDASGGVLLGCDNSLGPREDRHVWCGQQAGELEAHHLKDPRLDVGCQTGDRERMGFVWIEPGTAARYVAVEQRGYTEVYEVAAGLPVRVSTEDAGDSMATLRYSEHDIHGVLLRRAALRAFVAG
jgi:hypothetical protein